VIQITWTDIGRFLEQRHASFPEKMPGGGIQKQWPPFGKAFAEWFDKKHRGLTGYIKEKPSDVIGRYIYPIQKRRQ